MKFDKKFPPENEEQFQEFMNYIDLELRKEEIAISGRPTVARRKISSLYKVVFTSPMLRTEPIENCYTGESLHLRINRWFEQRYGERLKIDFIWKIAVLIRNDAYKIKLPWASGRHMFNVLELIEDFTKDYAKNLASEEIKEIVDIFKMGYTAKENIMEFSSLNMIEEAIGDIKASVSFIFYENPQYGLSKWSSLQATEKFLKVFIDRQNGKYKKTHILLDLLTEAEGLGLSIISKSQIDLIQCTPGVRYGEEKVSLLDAIKAHHSCLNICSQISQQM